MRPSPRVVARVNNPSNEWLFNENWEPIFNGDAGVKGLETIVALSKHAIEGVAAPESANNAAAQACFIPMLSLGIPPNALMALMIGAMMIHGIKRIVNYISTPQNPGDKGIETWASLDAARQTCLFDSAHGGKPDPQLDEHIHIDGCGEYRIQYIDGNHRLAILLTGTFFVAALIVLAFVNERRGRAMVE